MPVFASPTSKKEVSAAVQDAAAQKTTLRIRGGATRCDVGKPVFDAQALEVGALTGINRYEPGSLTLEAKAGTPLHEIETELAREGQMLAFEPMDHRGLMGTSGQPTIGGVVACNVSGPRRFISGACRDYLLGVGFVDGRGRILNNGGRVMKNVTGLDLTKLTCGAYGTLGIITDVALKVLPRPERSATILFGDLDVTRAAELFLKALATPYEVSGAAWSDGVAMLRVEGLSSQVENRVPKLLDLFKKFAGEVVEGDRHHRLWVDIRDVRVFADTDATIWKLSMKPTDAPLLALAAAQRLNAKVVMDRGGALIWLAVPTDAPWQAETIRGLIPEGNGHATLVRGGTDLRQAVPVFQPLHPRLESISDALRHQFDPDQILNPGLMAG